MTYPQGIAFRATSGYVTDVSPNWAETSSALDYPTTTAQSNTVGWESSPGSVIDTRDRSTTIPRLAGDAFGTGAGLAVFRLDLPASGNYNVNLAAGDASYSSSPKVELFDGASSLGVLCSGSTGAGNSFRDAANNIRTASAWVSASANGGSTVAATFAGSICRVKIGDGVSVNQPINYFYIAAAAAASAFGPIVKGGTLLRGLINGGRLTA